MKEHNEGFSIIELVVVTAILVIMSGGAVFGLSYFEMCCKNRQRHGSFEVKKYGTGVSHIYAPV